MTGWGHLGRGSGSQAVVERAVLKRLGPGGGSMFRGLGGQAVDPTGLCALPGSP